MKFLLGFKEDQNLPQQKLHYQAVDHKRKYPIKGGHGPHQTYVASEKAVEWKVKFGRRRERVPISISQWHTS